MMPGLVFVLTAIYLTFVVALVVSLLDHANRRDVQRKTLRRWSKFLLGLAILGIVVQVFTWFG